MAQFSFPLQRPLTIPLDKEKNRGLLTFSDRDFALGYRFIPDPRSRTLRIDLLVLEIATGEIARELQSFVVTDAGFPTGRISNEVEVAAWQAELLNLQSKARDADGALSILRVQERDAQGNYAEALDVLASLKTDEEREAQQIAVDIAKEHLENSRTALYEGEKMSETARLDVYNHRQIEVKPIPEYYNRYSDIIRFFDNTGAITLDGVTWARNLPFNGQTLGHYLK